MEKPVPRFPKATQKDASVTAISDLDIFARVARTGNMSAAGREMGLSPAVVSKRVSLLEDRLGEVARENEAQVADDGLGHGPELHAA